MAGFVWCGMAFAQDGSRITILVYNYADIPVDTLVRAEDTAARIFRHAGIETVWRDCRADDFLPKHVPCPGPSALSPGLRIQSRFQLVPNTVRRDTMGFSTGYLATISLEYAEDLARSSMGAVPEILGHIAAHEVGHVLLPGTRHTVSGIMRARWSLNDWDLLRQGSLFFTPPQAHFLRNELLVEAPKAPCPEIASHCADTGRGESALLVGRPAN
jgi:hypothetical protein